jgi:hypothetical protein
MILVARFRQSTSGGGSPPQGLFWTAQLFWCLSSPAPETPWRRIRVSTEGPLWGHSRFVLGAIGSFLKPLCGHLSPKVVKISQNRLLIEGSKGLGWIERRCFIGGDGGQFPSPRAFERRRLPPLGPAPFRGGLAGGSPSFPTRNPALISKRAGRGLGRRVRLAPSPAHHARIPPPPGAEC